MEIKDNFLKESHEFCCCDIEKYLDYNLNIEIHKKVSSTNTVLKEMAVNKAPHGTVVIAEEQTMGKGRMGRSFHSPSGSGIYFSILLRPDIPAEEALFLTTSAAVSVSKAIEDISDKKADIKWVNDIYIDGKKVCGILTESAFNTQSGKLDYAIVGIGINICPPQNGFPTDVENIATAIFDEYGDFTEKRNILIANILNYFMDYYNNFSDKKYVNEYINRSIIIGKDITVIGSDTNRDATALEIDNECRLKVRYTNGSEEWLNSGEVSTKIHK